MLAVLPLGQACGGSAEPEETQTAAPAVYEVRGVIRLLRDPGHSRIQITILHEAIPEFVGINGDVVGMKSMTMPFAAADPLDLTGFEPGSRVRFDLAVDWNRTEPALITAIEMLPDEELLSFESID